MKKNDAPIIVEQTFNSSIEAIWNALTDINQMHKWYFEKIPAFKPQIGFKTQFIIKSEERVFLHLWEVTEVEPLKLIKYTWEFAGYRGKSTSTFEITKQGNLTKLSLTINILADFSDDIPEFKRESCIAGWDFFIHKRLFEYIGKKL